MAGSTSPRLGIPAAALGRLMPMFLWLSPAGRVRAAGPTLERLCAPQALAGRPLRELFELVRPQEGGPDPARLAGQRLQLRLRAPPHTALRGLAVALAGRQGVLLNLSFGLSLTEAVRDHALTEADFAATDLAIELLYLNEAKNAVMEELGALNRRLQTARRAAEERALTDPLTGLGNRRALELALQRAAGSAAAGGPGFALAHLDLDHFKAVNDSLGHAAGDRVLLRVAEVLRGETREQDVVARIGGDEFVLLLPGLTDPARLSALARRVIAGLETPIEAAGHPCRISASIGMALSPDHPDPARLLHAADTALYAAKRAGRARWAFAGA